MHEREESIDPLVIRQTLRAAERARLRVKAVSAPNDNSKASRPSINVQRVRGYGCDVWRTPIRKVEGRHGSVVASALEFIKFGLVVNLLQTLAWSLLLVSPFISSPPASFTWTVFRAKPAKYLLQGYGLSTTFLLYGGYTLDDKTHRSRPDLCMPLAYILAYAATIFALVSTLYSRLQFSSEGGVARGYAQQMFPCCTLVFASWSFCTLGSENSRLERRALRSQLKELISDVSLQEVHISDSVKAVAKLRKIFSISVLWPSLMAVTGITTYLAVIHGNTINEACGLSYMSPLIVTSINITGSFLVKKTVELEGWAPHTAVKVAAIKLFTLKADYMAVLLYSLFRIRQDANHKSVAVPQRLAKCSIRAGVLADTLCSSGFTCCGASCASSMQQADLLGRCVPGCVENYYGQVFYRQVISNGILINLADAAVAIVKRCLLKADVPFEAHAVMMQTIENGVLVLLGSLYFPLLPVLGMAGNIFTFYIRIILANYVHHPPKVRTSAAHMSILAHLLMAGGVALSSFPLVLNLGWQRHRCGPNVGSSMRNAIVNAINAGPSAISSILGFWVSPVALLTLVVGLLSTLILTRSIIKRLIAQSQQLQHELKSLRKRHRAILEQHKSHKRKNNEESLEAAVSIMQIMADEGRWVIQENEAWNFDSTESRGNV